MSKTRMAGEAIKDANFEARSRLSNDPEEAKRRAGLVGDKYDVSGYSDKEISMALMGSSFGDKDYARLTGKSFGDDAKEDSPVSDTPAGPNPSPRPNPERPPLDLSPEKPAPIVPLPGIRKPGAGSMTQNVTQDNDITNTINGDNNEVSNFQDNSISQSMGSSDYPTRYARGLKDKYVLNLLNR